MSRITIQDLECHLLVGLFRGSLAVAWGGGYMALDAVAVALQPGVKRCRANSPIPVLWSDRREPPRAECGRFPQFDGAPLGAQLRRC